MQPNSCSTVKPKGESAQLHRMPNCTLPQRMSAEKKAIFACNLPSPVEHVLLNGDLLRHIFQLVTPAEGFCLVERAKLATVCRTWRETLQLDVPASLTVRADTPAETLTALLDAPLTHVKTIKVESGASSMTQARVLKLLRSESMRCSSGQTLEHLSGVLLYGCALADLADRFPNLATLVCSSFWGNERSASWLPHNIQELDFTLDSRYRISAFSETPGARFLEGCTSLRGLTLRNFSQIALSYMPPTLERVTFYEARDVSNAETLQLASDTAGLKSLTICMPGGRSRDRRSGRKPEPAKVTPSDHWQFAKALEYVAAPGQALEVQPSGMTIGWASTAPDEADRAKAARDFAVTFVESQASEVSFRTPAFQLVMSVELQSDLLRPYISHALTGEQLATYIQRDFGRKLEVVVTADCVTLRRNYASRSRLSPVRA